MTVDAVVFPGQGAQRVGMGAPLLRRFPDLVREAEDIVRRPLGRLITDGPDADLVRTRNAQPAVYLVNALYWRQLQEDGRIPRYLLGHSLGEYNALHAAGAFGFVDGLRLVDARARAADTVRGAMVAVVGLTRREMSAVLDELRLPDVWIVNHNSERQLVLSGRTETVLAARGAAESAGAKLTVRLRAAGPFHSPLMADAAAAFAPVVHAVPIRALHTPVVGNLTARPYRDGEIAASLVAHLVRPVLWQRSVEWLWQRHGGPDMVRFVEAGPCRTMTTMIRHIRADLEARRAHVPAAPEGAPAMDQATHFTLAQLDLVVHACMPDGLEEELSEANLDTPFIDLGMDSLGLVELAERLHLDLGVPVPAETVEDLRTPRLALEYVRRCRSAEDVA